MAVGGVGVKGGGSSPLNGRRRAEVWRTVAQSVASLPAVVFLCAAANFINSADRVIMPVAIVGLAKEHRYTLHQQGWILSAFPAGYISSQIIGSCAGAQLGSRRLLLFVVLMWSLSTLLTPVVASSLHMLVFARVILGLGEGLGLPTMYHILAESVAPEQRARAFGYLAAAGGVGQTMAALVSPHFSWRAPFYAFGLAGFAWCGVWLRSFLQLMGGDANVGGLAGGLIVADQLMCRTGPNPVRQWRSFFSTPALWAIYAAHFSMNWTAYVTMHWLPTYLHSILKANPAHLSLACMPYLLNSVASILVGHMADSLVNRHQLSIVRTRKLFTLIGLVGPALMLFMFSWVTHLYTAVLLISLSMGLLAFNAAGHLSNHADISPKFAGITFAISNTIATLPGLLVGPLTAEFVVESSGRWWTVFVLAGIVNLVGAVVYASHAAAKQLL